MSKNGYQDKEKRKIFRGFLKFFSNDFWLNKYILVFAFIYVLSCIGGTYAYLAFSASNNSVVVGEVGVADLELSVTKVTANNGELVPQLEKSLDTAVSSSYNCVDGNGNTVCQVYKIEIENTGTANIVVDGTIDFTNTTLPNLKYKLMTDSTTLDTSFNSRYGYGDMPDRPLVKGVSLEPEQVETYYIVLWINDTENEQSDTGTYRASINFNSSYLEGLTSTYVNYLVGFSNRGDISYFHNDTYKNKIKNVAFVNYIDTSDAVASWDMGTLKNGGIMAWVDNNITSGYYDLYIGSQDVIRGKDMKYFFCDMEEIDSINFDNLDTSEVIDMQLMFYRSGYNSSIFTLDLGDNFDTSSVTYMNHMFSEVGGNNMGFMLDLGDKFDTSNVTDMNWMFWFAGYKSLTFTLDLGEKFDTSNVTDMSNMFCGAGNSSTVFTLDLGNKFDTSNVGNMTNMFRGIGAKSLTFTLDLGDKFDTSNVGNMTSMFRDMGYESTILTLNLGDKFDTSNVSNMSNMFNGVGNSSTVFTLDLGDKFDTSNVTDMSYMFYYTGWNSMVFTLDLGDKFDTSSATNMSWMFRSVGYSSTVFTLDLGESFDTSSVINMSNMFGYTGYTNNNLELDLTMFTFDNVTNFDSMFNDFKSTQKIYVKNQSDKDWLVGKGFSSVTNNNVIVRS